MSLPIPQTPEQFDTWVAHQREIEAAIGSIIRISGELVPGGHPGLDEAAQKLMTHSMVPARDVMLEIRFLNDRGVMKA